MSKTNMEEMKVVMKVFSPTEVNQINIAVHGMLENRVLKKDISDSLLKLPFVCKVSMLYGCSEPDNEGRTLIQLSLSPPEGKLLVPPELLVSAEEFDGMYHSLISSPEYEECLKKYGLTQNMFIFKLLDEFEDLRHINRVFENRTQYNLDPVKNFKYLEVLERFRKIMSKQAVKTEHHIEVLERFRKIMSKQAVKTEHHIEVLEGTQNRMSEHMEELEEQIVTVKEKLEFLQEEEKKRQDVNEQKITYIQMKQTKYIWFFSLVYVFLVFLVIFTGKQNSEVSNGVILYGSTNIDSIVIATGKCMMVLGGFFYFMVLYLW
jgi:hypothetical protein